jgi:hypothetical protein
MTLGIASSHVMRLEAENRRLVGEIHKLRSQLSAMRLINGLPDTDILPFGLPPSAGVMFAALMARNVVSNDSILDLLYGGRADGGPTDGVRTVRVLISRMRAMLAPYGIEIENDYNQGYSFSPATKAKIHELLNGGNHESTQPADNPPGTADCEERDRQERIGTAGTC